MRLDLMTWQEVDSALKQCDGIILPTGSTEQHGPMGLIGTDAICAEQIARAAGERARAIVAPTLAYTPSPFNLSFPGTISISSEVFEGVVRDIFSSLIGGGFGHIYVLNGHGANLAPIRTVADEFTEGNIRIRSWWDFDPVNEIRTAEYGEWEGMHGTPSEVAITQATDRILPPGDAAEPPRKLTPDYIREHAGDRHGPPDEHRRDFPDGRVGSHSALATPEVGERLLETAAAAVAEDFLEFMKS